MRAPCIEWRGSRGGSNKAYGLVPKLIHSTERYAHRWAYEKFFGPIPHGMHVLHHCDNPPCIRPQHLFLGTQATNMADMYAKGRDKFSKRPACPRCGGEWKTVQYGSQSRRRTCPNCVRVRHRRRYQTEPEYRARKCRRKVADA